MNELRAETFWDSFLGPFEWEKPCEALLFGKTHILNSHTGAGVLDNALDGLLIRPSLFWEKSSNQFGWVLKFCSNIF